MILSAVDAVYKFSRPLLFRLDPELTHNAANALLKRFGSLLPPYQPSPALNQDIFSQSLKSPVGLSAGFDKYGTLFPMMSRLGLDFSELGSFTALAQEGNPRPRVRRLLFEKALLNKMGFNNPGLEDGLGNIKELLKTYRGDHKIAISLGRSKTTKNNAALKEYELLMKKINLFLKEDRSHETSFFYTAVNLSSPNTPGLRELQDAGALSELIRTLKKASTQPPRDGWERILLGASLVVKFSPDFRSSREFMRSLEVKIRCYRRTRGRRWFHFDEYLYQLPSARIAEGKVVFSTNLAIAHKRCLAMAKPKKSNRSHQINFRPRHRFGRCLYAPGSVQLHIAALLQCQARISRE